MGREMRDEVGIFTGHRTRGNVSRPAASSVWQAIRSSSYGPDQGSHSSHLRRLSRASGAIRNRLIVGFPNKAARSLLLIEHHIEQNDFPGDILSTQPVEIRKAVSHDNFGIDPLRRGRMISAQSSDNNLLGTARRLSRITHQFRRFGST